MKVGTVGLTYGVERKLRTGSGVGAGALEGWIGLDEELWALEVGLG